MIGTIIDTIAAKVRELNPYFDKHFTDVIADSERGYVWVDKGGDYTPVFPNDTLGNYFYIRHEPDFAFSFNADYSAGITPGLQYNTTATLVASVIDADPNKLASNIIASLRTISCAASVTVISARANRNAIIAQELQGLEEADLEKALSNIDRRTTLVSVNFSVTGMVSIVKCSLQNPCKCP